MRIEVAKNEEITVGREVEERTDVELMPSGARRCGRDVAIEHVVFKAVEENSNAEDFKRRVEIGERRDVDDRKADGMMDCN